MAAFEENLGPSLRNERRFFEIGNKLIWSDYEATERPHLWLLFCIVIMLYIINFEY